MVLSNPTILILLPSLSGEPRVYNLRAPDQGLLPI